MRRHSGIQACGLGLLSLCFFTSCATPTQRQPAPADDLTALARTAPFITNTERPHPASVPDNVVTILKEKKQSGKADHLGLLVEYGLRVHWQYLQHTRLARQLPVDSDMMLSELIRITEIPKYTTAHQAGWLNSQFYGKFNQTGWSSYQVYIWTKENVSTILSDDKTFPNWKQISKIMETIDNSSLNGVGGGGVCHYGCI